MKSSIPASLALLALLSVAPETSASRIVPREADTRETRARESFVPRFVQAIAKRLGLAQGNIDVPLPPRP